MTRGVFRAGVAMALLGLAACAVAVDVQVDDDGVDVRGSGVIVTETRTVGSFHRISVTGAASVRIERTGRERVRVTTDDNLLAYFETKVRGGVLYLGPRSSVSLEPTTTITVVVDMVDIESLDASGAVAATVGLGTRADFSATLSGATSVSTAGAVDRLDLVLSGASHFNAEDLEATRATVTTSGVCWTVVNVRNALTAWASGVSSIRYLGSPSVEAHVSGVATIEPL